MRWRTGLSSIGLYSVKVQAAYSSNFRPRFPRRNGP